MDKTAGGVRRCEKQLETYKAYVAGQLEAVEFDCSRRVTIDDLK